MFSFWHMFSGWRWQSTLLNLIYGCQLIGKVTKLVQPPLPSHYHSYHYHVPCGLYHTVEAVCILQVWEKLNDPQSRTVKETKLSKQWTVQSCCKLQNRKQELLKLHNLHDQWPWNISTLGSMHQITMPKMINTVLSTHSVLLTFNLTQWLSCRKWISGSLC